MMPRARHRGTEDGGRHHILAPPMDRCPRKISLVLKSWCAFIQGQELRQLRLDQRDRQCDEAGELILCNRSRQKQFPHISGALIRCTVPVPTLN